MPASFTLNVPLRSSLRERPRAVPSATTQNSVLSVPCLRDKLLVHGIHFKWSLKEQILIFLAVSLFKCTLTLLPLVE